jgi:AraC family transcriptional regulator
MARWELPIIQKRYLRGSRLPQHSHPECSLIVTLRGHFTERTRRKTRTVTPGMAMLRVAAEVHADDFEDDTLCLAVSLPASFFEIVDALPPPRETIVIAGARVAGLTARLARENAAHHPLSNIAAQGIALELVAEVWRGDEPANLRATRQIAIAREHIVAGCATPLRIADIATSVGLHPVRLSRLFKRAYGCTPSEMLREQRVTRAAALIRQGRLSLTDIARCCGFYDQSHFSNTFRCVMGLTPGQYAQQTR